MKAKHYINGVWGLGLLSNGACIDREQKCKTTLVEMVRK